MPSPLLKKLAKETGKKEKELEKYWKQAKEIAADTFGKDPKDFGNKEFAFVTTTTKRLAGIREAIDINEFLDSDMTADEFLETVVSSQFPALSKGAIIPPDKEEDDEEDEKKEKKKKDGKPLKKGDPLVAIQSTDPTVTREEIAPIEDMAAYEALLDSKLE